jgi:hypothetical protein
MKVQWQVNGALDLSGRALDLILVHHDERSVDGDAVSGNWGRRQ